MITCLLFICISLTVISNTFGSIHDPDSRKDYGNNRQKLLDLDYGVHLSSVEEKKAKKGEEILSNDYDISSRNAVGDSPENNKEPEDRKKRLSAPSSGLKSVTMKPTRCTTGKTITLDPEFEPESPETNEVINDKQSGITIEKMNTTTSSGSKGESRPPSQKYERPPGPNVLPDYYVDDN